MRGNPESARRHLDARFQKIPFREMLTRPQKGWLRAVREALGMTAEQVGQRLGVSKARISAMEKDELRGSLTLTTLERAAQALGCRLVYAIVPEDTLQTTVENQAKRKAAVILSRTGHTMGLEAQSVTKQEHQAQFNRLVSDILSEHSSKLWETP